jgi:hypothetical protein
MADDLKIVADFSDLQLMRRELVGISKDAKSSASVFEREFAKVERQLVNQERAFRRSAGASQSFYNELLGVSRATKSASASASVFEKELGRVEKATIRATKAQANSNAALHQTKNRMNGNNVAIQQLGYQVGDFAVQVQGGTSAFVAFSQQGAQLAGILPMIAGPLGLSMGAAVGLSAALGILIPIGSAAGRMLFEMFGNAEKAEDALKNLKKSTDLYTIASGFASKASHVLAREYGNLAYQAKNLFAAQKALAKLDALESLSKSLVAVRDQFGDFSDATVVSLELARDTYNKLGDDITKAYKLSDQELRAAVDATNIYNETVKSLERQLGASTDQAFAFAIELSKLSQAKGPAEAANQLEVVRGLFTDIIGGQDKATESQRALLRQLVESAIAALELNVAFEEVAKGTKNAVGEAQELFEQLQKQRSMLSRASGDERAAIEQKVTAALLAAQDAYLESIKTSHEAGIKLTELDLKSPFDSALPAARLLAQTMSLTLIDALNLINAATAGSGPAGGRGKSKGAGSTQTDRQLMRLGGVQHKPPKTREDGGAGESPTEGFAEYLDGLKQQAELEKQLVGLFDEKRAEEEAVIQARQKYGEVFGTTQEAELRGTLAQIEADKERQRVLEEAKQQQEALASMIAGQMGDAFMSIVDGTKSVKDAFKDMARAIIKELYQVFVVKKITGFIEGFVGGIGSGSSSISSIRPQARPFADGGVVGSPTYFPMAGGKTGLMGEAGPEAIMPLKRGANGKLGVQMEGGSQGNVVVNQSFNFSANGDDSVKKLIAQAAPKIAQMTKSSLLDDRRRGGSTKAAFG